jgi:hypothetical protein
MKRDKPIDVLYEVMSCAVLCNLNKKQPGAVILRLPESRRKILKELASKDVERMRPPGYYGAA